MRTALLIICAIAIDAFLGQGILSGGRLYTGFAVMLLFTRQGRQSAALAVAVAYGVALDVLEAGVPFGTMLASHVLVWLLLALGRNTLAALRGFRAALAAGALVFAYGAFIEWARYALTALAGNLDVSFSAGVFAAAAFSALATVVLAALLAWCGRAASRSLRARFLIR
ncbi:MAG: hypothetical protein AAB671_01555 [Patescibacteria group bacterium]